MAKAHAMLVAYDPTTNTVLTSATVNVYNPGTVTPISATIYDKNNNPLSNPLTADATTALVDFYLSVAQEVDLVISKASFTTRTYSNVPVFDDASNDLSALLTTTGQILYASSANTPAALGIGSGGAFLTVSGGVPAWSNTISAGGLTVTASSGSGFKVLTGGNGDVFVGGAAQPAALATSEVTGFLYVPTCAGTPTGVPTNHNTGAAAIVGDSTGSKIWIYFNNIGAWRGVAVA